MIQYTPAQTKVIKIRDKNVLVSAAAGSGKTAVLTARIVDRILDKDDPVSIDRLLIVTFTEAAAAEMRERIGNAIAQKLKDEPDNEVLRAQQTLVHSALIMTIHGFCLYLIRNHFDRIGIDPSFRVSSDEEAKLLLEDSLEEVLEELWQSDPEKYALLEDRFSPGLLDGKLKDVLKSLHYTALSQPFVQEWYEQMKAHLSAFAASPKESEIYRFVKKYEDNTLRDCKENLEKAIEAAKSEGGPEKYLPALYDDLAFTESLLSKETVAERSIIYRAHEFPALAKEKASELKDYVKGIRDEVRERLKKLKEKFYLLDAGQAISDDVATCEVLTELLSVAATLSEKYDKKKREKNIIDFSDMEHFALKILLRIEDGKPVPTDVALSYREFFKEVMVDEYQDSNFIQESLLQAVSRDSKASGNRFMVGDVKQSIYRFRLARPEIFRQKYKTYSKDDSARDVRIDLSSNFRSRTEVLNAVNRVFEDAMQEAVGDIEYDEDSRLYYGATYYGGPKEDCKSELIVLPEEEWKKSPVKEKIAWEAMACGKRILDLISEEYKVVDKAEDGVVSYRNVQFGDIMILVKKAKKRATYVKQVLEQMGIPTMVISREGYFMAPEVILMLNFIAILNNPRQDIPLMGVLHSFIGNFKESEIAEIRGATKDVLLYDSLVSYMKTGTDATIRKKLQVFIDKLNTYREWSVRESVYELLVRIYAKEGVCNHYRLLRLGEQRVANLKILLKKAEEYASTGFVGLSEFVRYIENVKNREIDFGEANTLDENANVVRIYTMHKSKGLEFPVCFLLGCGEKLVTSMDRKEVLTDDNLGMAADYADPVLRIKRKSFSKAAIQTRESMEKRGEDLRLLYVAMTRAKEKLIMIGTAGKKLMESVQNAGGNRKFTTTEIMNATSYLNFLLPEAARNPEILEYRICTIEESKEAEALVTMDRAFLKEELLQTPKAGAFIPYTYPHESLLGVYTKTTVSDLKKAAYLEEEEAADELFKDAEGYAEDGSDEYVPAFIRGEEKRSSGSIYGTAHHRVMELLPFGDFTKEEIFADPVLLKEKISKLREGFVNRDYIPKDQDSLVRTGSIVTFLQTNLAERMRIADLNGALYREQPFVLSLPASELNPAFPSGEKVLVQGVIDAYFEEDGELVLMDYKTDSKVDEEELKKRYKAQLRYYSIALEKLEHKKVKEIYLYSFFLGKEIRL